MTLQRLVEVQRTRLDRSAIEAAVTAVVGKDDQRLVLWRRLLATADAAASD